MSSALFQAASDWLGHRKGGIAMASVGACAGFGAICGSSLATASTMGQVALPEMRKRGYSDSLSTGVLAAGGTLGILIPPSIILVIYAILAEQNIVKMFVAAIVPGLLAALGYNPRGCGLRPGAPRRGDNGRACALQPADAHAGADLAGRGDLRPRDGRDRGGLGLVAGRGAGAFHADRGRGGGRGRHGALRHVHRRADVEGLSRERAGHGAGDRDDLLHRLGGETLQRVSWR